MTRHDITGIHLGILEYDALSEDQLRQSAGSVLRTTHELRARSPERRRSFFAGRTVVSLLFAKLKLDAFIEPNAEFGYLEVVDSEGKAFNHLFANISHTDAIAVAAVAPLPIGIDVESKKRLVKEGVLDRIADPKEKTATPFSCPVALWSAKEAASKACGLGIKFGMRAFVLTQIASNEASVEFTVTGPLSLSYAVAHQETYKDYVISICTERDLFGKLWINNFTKS